MARRKRVLLLHPRDNVAVALEDLEPGDEVSVEKGESEVVLKVLDRVPFGHKVAVVDIPLCGWVYKYGHPIGRAKKSIARGSHVHVHNLESAYTIRGVCSDEHHG